MLILSGPNYKPSILAVQVIQTLKIQVPTIHNVVAAGQDRDHVQGFISLVGRHIPQAVAKGKLFETHIEKLIVAREFLGAVITFVAVHYFAKFVFDASQ